MSRRALTEGDEIYSALFEDGETFRRVDYSVDAWQGPPPEAFCHFKSRVPIKQKKKRLLVDDEMLYSFFERLANETEPVRLQFRFVLALILMRKRLLRYESTAVEKEQEVWTMIVPRKLTQHKVINPQLTEDQIDGVSRQLDAILHGDSSEWVDEPIGSEDAQDAVPESDTSGKQEGDAEVAPGTSAEGITDDG